jgi:hypothetical protein
LADKHAELVREVVEAAEVAAPSDRWDPSALFTYDDTGGRSHDATEPPEPPVDEVPKTSPSVTVNEKIDLRSLTRPVRPVRAARRPQAASAPALEPAASAADAPDATSAWTESRYRALLSHRRGQPRAPQATTSPQAARRPAAPSSVSEQLRELNRARREGEISDDEFNARKAAVFEARRGTSTRARVAANPA